MTLQGARACHILFAVIPAKAGIQRILRGARLDPGSALRAVRDDVPARRCTLSGMTLQGARARHILFAVIPAKAGIQWILRGICLDPGSALRAVRDDVESRGAVRGGLSLLGVIPAKAEIQWILRGICLDPGSALQAVRDDVPARRCAPSGMTYRLGTARPAEKEMKQCSRRAARLSPAASASIARPAGARAGGIPSARRRRCS